MLDDLIDFNVITAYSKKKYQSLRVLGVFCINDILKVTVTFKDCLKKQKMRGVLYKMRLVKSDVLHVVVK